MSARRRLPAKLAQPRLSAAVARGRLFERLDAERERALTWVAGPPGAGKTTLVSSYVAQSGCAALWYRLDGGDGDLATFFHYLGVAAGAVTHQHRLRLPALTPEYRLDLPGFTRRYFRTLFAALPAASALVLDSFEAAPEGALEEVLDLAVAEVPSGVRVYVTSRREVPAVLGHWLAKGLLVQIPWSELRLSGAEAQAIAGRHDGGTDAGAVRTLHALSDGWVAGFVVLLEHLRRTGAVAAERGVSAVRESLFAYFAHERFARSAAAERELLVCTALLPSFSAGQAVALGGQADGAEILERLYREHYFIDRSVGREPMYRYHDLFRDFLLEQGRALLGPERRNALLEQAGALLVAAGRGDEALGLYAEAGAHAAGAGLICELAPALLRQGRNAVLEQAIGALPAALLTEVPWLSYWLGLARLPFHPPAGRALLEAAFERFEAAEDTTACLLAASAIIDSFMIEWSDMHGIDRWADAVARLMRHESAFPSVEIEVRVLASLNALMHRSLKYAALRATTCTRLLALLPSIHDVEIRMLAALAIASDWILGGNWARLRQLIDEVAPVLETAEVPRIQALTWHVIRGLRYQQSAEFDRALAELGRAATLALDHGIRVYDVTIAAYQAYCALNMGELDGVETYLAKMRAALNPARRVDVSHYEWIAAALALARGDPATASTHVRAGLDKARACGADFPTLQCRTLLVIVQMESGEHDAALAEIDEMLADAVTARHRAYEQAGLMLKAHLLLRTGAEPEGLTVLGSALAIAREHGYRIIFPWAPAKILQSLCGVALQAGIEVGYVRDLIRRLRLAPVDVDDGGWPWPVKVHTFGHFAVLREEAPLPFQGKAQRKPLELLKTLVMLGGEAVAEDELIGRLWPEPPADGGQKALDVTVHRLRKLLGSGEALQVTDRRVTLNAAVVWVDALAVERVLARMTAAPAGAPVAMAQMEAAAPRLLQWYRGEFLAGEAPVPALVAVRERLWGRMRRFLERLGEHWERAGRWGEAAGLYQRGVELDAVAEGMYRCWMRCLQRQGHTIEAIEVYRRCRQMLSLLLGVKPGAETEALYRELLAAARR